MPASWPGYTAQRLFRGVMYHITVERAGPGNRVALAVDGQPVEGNVVPVPAPGQAEVIVMATLS